MCCGGRSYGSSPGFGVLPVTAQVLTSIVAAPNGGFWLPRDVRSSIFQPRLDGTYQIDGAPEYSNFASLGNIVGSPGTNGYWIVTGGGKIVARGSGLPTLCGEELSNCSNFPSNPNSEQIIVAAAATPTGQGLWAASRDGSLWTAGDAEPYGDVRNQPPITGIAGALSGTVTISSLRMGAFSAPVRRHSGAPRAAMMVVHR